MRRHVSGCKKLSIKVIVCRCVKLIIFDNDRNDKRKRDMQYRKMKSKGGTNINFHCRLIFYPFGIIQEIATREIKRKRNSIQS